MGEGHGLVTLLWFFSIPVLVVSADISRRWDWLVFLQIGCFCKCNSVGRLGSRVSPAASCLSGAGQPCLVQGSSSVAVLGFPPLSLGQEGLVLWTPPYRAVTPQSCLPRTAVHLSNTLRSGQYFQWPKHTVWRKWPLEMKVLSSLQAYSLRGFN